MPNRVTPDDISAGRQTLNELAEASGRDPESISVSVFGQAADRSLIGELFDAGADRVMIRVETADEDATNAQLDQIAEAVLS